MDRKKFWNFFTIVWNWDKFQKFVLFLQKAHIWERNFFRKLIYMGRKCIECFSICLNFLCMKTSSFKNTPFFYTNTLFCPFFSVTICIWKAWQQSHSTQIKRRIFCFKIFSKIFCSIIQIFLTCLQMSFKT